MVANQACFSRKPAFNHFLSTCRSMGTCVKSHSWLILSKQALMSPSRIHWGPCRWLNKRMGLCQGIGTAAFPPKAIGMAVGLGFRDGIEAEQVECLHGPIGHRGNPEAASLAVALGNVHPAERLRLITVPTQGAESGRLGFRCVPEDSVHTGSLRTRITDHS